MKVRELIEELQHLVEREPYRADQNVVARTIVYRFDPDLVEDSEDCEIAVETLTPHGLCVTLNCDSVY